MIYETISAERFQKLAADKPNICMIDVRTEVEHAECHVDGVALFPLQNLKAEEVLERTGAADAIYILCKAGGRAKKAAEELARHTDTPLVVVEGGTDACVALGMPANRGKEIMSLERQVRIAAGALVVTGVALSYLVDPAFIGLSAFVGAGLMFAGITDTCAMGMMLARMPWNKVAKNAGTEVTA